MLENSCSHTAGDEDYPWWAVDLQQVYQIHHVEIYNRDDCCGKFYFNILEIDFNKIERDISHENISYDRLLI